MVNLIKSEFIEEMEGDRPLPRLTDFLSTRLSHVLFLLFFFIGFVEGYGMFLVFYFYDKVSNRDLLYGLEFTV